MKDDGERTLTHRIRSGIKELALDESGLTTVEYALLVAVLAVGAIFAYRHFGQATSDLASDSTQSLPGHGGEPPSP